VTSTFKLYGTIALIVILGLMAWGVKNWDSNRLEAQFEAGELAERAKWQAAQKEATDKAVIESNQDTLASEGVADEARDAAGKTIAASTAATQTIVEKIVYAYRTAPPTACLPTDLPLGVQAGLSEARSAALSGSSAAPGGLQPAERN
jgi:hypothetical protein